MGFSIDQIVPWGLSYEEFLRMFDLTETDLKKRILGCADGPASFNATMARCGRRVISCDPLYQFSGEAIGQRIQETYEEIIGQTRAHQADYHWSGIIDSPEALGQIRMEAMREFLADYPCGQAEGRYVGAALPRLPFTTNQFDLALCSHFLFTYSDHLTEDFHVAAALEIGRVAREVRIFPLLNMDGQTSPHLAPVIAALERQGAIAQFKTVPYEFQRGGNQMLWISKTNQGV